MPETKKKVVPLSERETIITYNDAEKTANVYTMNLKLSRKLLAMAQEYPSLVKFVRKYPDSAVEYELPKKSITVSKPRVKRVINVPETPNYGKEELEKQSFVNCMEAWNRKPDQTIHPYMFAKSTEDTENYVTKATSLWLVNLPVLHGTGLPKPDNAVLFGRLPSGKARTWEDTISRSAKVRSKTFPGIAEAMAEQWGNYIRNGE